ncbi:MAG: polyphosphate polymerase domain-containing protein [Eubacteriales bacterium]
MKMMKFRHEEKFICSAAQMMVLQARLEQVLKLDSHIVGNSYEIRSIYFDDFKNTYFYENEWGVEPREKYRIRTYQENRDLLKLELKRKVRGMTHKTSCLLTQEQVHLFMQGKIPPIEKDSPKLLQKFILECNTRLMKPKVVVVYQRIPFIYQEGNVRITLDSNIMSSNRIDCFLDDSIWGRNIMDSDRQVLEVKYDEFLPNFIRDVLQTQHLQRTAYSKYYLCRKYNMGKGVYENEF